MGRTAEYRQLEEDFMEVFIGHVIFSSARQHYTGLFSVEALNFCKSKSGDAGWWAELQLIPRRVALVCCSDWCGME